MSTSSSFDEPPAKPARGSAAGQNKPQERQRAISVGYSLNSGANFYDIPAASLFSYVSFETNP
jgi:hypothetical protein